MIGWTLAVVADILVALVLILGFVKLNEWGKNQEAKKRDRLIYPFIYECPHCPYRVRASTTVGVYSYAVEHEETHYG